MKKNKNSLITGMIVGGAVGSILSLLFSSKKNRTTMKEYSKKAFTGGKSLLENFLQKHPGKKSDKK